MLRFLACIVFDFVLSLDFGAQHASPNIGARSGARQFSFFRCWKHASFHKCARQAMAKIQSASGARVCDRARYPTQLVRGHPKPLTCWFLVWGFVGFVGLLVCLLVCFVCLRICLFASFLLFAFFVVCLFVFVSCS